MTDQMIRVKDADAGLMLKKLADFHKRSMGKEAAWLIRAEYVRRFGKNVQIREEIDIQMSEPETCTIDDEGE